MPSRTAFQKLVCASGKSCPLLSFVSEQTDTAILHRTVSNYEAKLLKVPQIRLVVFFFCLFAKNVKCSLVVAGIF